MARGIALLALVAVAGCASPAPSTDTSTTTTPAPDASPAASAPARDPIADRVWAAADAGAPPGTIRVFLADGTLLMDSCFETYRIARWTRVDAGTISWNEDGAEIRATVAEATDDALVLRLALVGGETREERYRTATVPFTCPDMPR